MQSPREKFLAEESEIAANNEQLDDVLKEPNDDKDIDRLADELTNDDGKVRPIDKNMGQKKVVVTQAEYQKSKQEKQFKDTLGNIQQLSDARVDHLNIEHKKVINLILSLAENDKLNNPVLEHLVRQKVILSTQFTQASVAIKALQQKLMNDIATATNNVVKCKGAIEEVDRQLIAFIRDNPKALTYNNDKEDQSSQHSD